MSMREKWQRKAAMIRARAERTNDQEKLNRMNEATKKLGGAIQVGGAFQKRVSLSMLRRVELLEAMRVRLLAKGKLFYSPSIACPSCKKCTKRRTDNGQCTKCLAFLPTLQ
jgi:hypothetical protein